MTKEQLEQELTEARAALNQHNLLDPQLYRKNITLQRAIDSLKTAEANLRKLSQKELECLSIGTDINDQILNLSNVLVERKAPLEKMIEERSPLLTKIAQIKKQLEPFLDKNSNN